MSRRLLILAGSRDEVRSWLDQFWYTNNDAECAIEVDDIRGRSEATHDLVRVGSWIASPIVYFHCHVLVSAFPCWEDSPEWRLQRSVQTADVFSEGFVNQVVIGVRDRWELVPPVSVDPRAVADLSLVTQIAIAHQTAQIEQRDREISAQLAQHDRSEQRRQPPIPDRLAAWCETNGWTEPEYANGRWWAYAGADVMKTPIPADWQREAPSESGSMSPDEVMNRLAAITNGLLPNGLSIEFICIRAVPSVGLHIGFTSGHGTNWLASLETIFCRPALSSRLTAIAQRQLGWRDALASLAIDLADFLEAR